MAVQSEIETPPVAVAPTITDPGVFSRQAIKNTEDGPVETKVTANVGDLPRDRKSDKSLDTMTLFAMMTQGQQGFEEQPQNDGDFAKGFQRFVQAFELEETKVTINGKETTLGALSRQMVDTYGESRESTGSVQNVLGNARLPGFVGLSGADVGKAEARAQQAGVLGAIQYASQSVGANYGFMLSVAQQESGFRAGVRASTSSATGLYQFIDSTWAGKNGNGGMLGSAENRGLIEKAYRDVYHRDIDIASMSRGEKLALRTDPLANAVMGAKMYHDNKEYLENRLGRAVNNTDIYMANFLGQAGAGRFLEQMGRNPGMAASAAMSGGQASANSWVNGLSAVDLYRKFSGKVSDEGAGAFQGRTADISARVADATSPIRAAVEQQVRQAPSAVRTAFHNAADMGHTVGNRVSNVVADAAHSVVSSGRALVSSISSWSPSSWFSS